jgi:hypothetical protein
MHRLETTTRPAGGVSMRLLHRAAAHQHGQGAGDCSPLGRILLVADVAAPRGVAASVVGLLVGELRCSNAGCGTVPVILGLLKVDAVAQPYFLDRSSLPLAQADPFGDKDRLAGRVAVPRGPGSRREVDNSAHDPRGRRRCADDVDVDASSEPVAGTAGRFDPFLVICILLLLCRRPAQVRDGPGDPFGDVAHEHVHHRVGHLGAEHRGQRRAAEGLRGNRHRRGNHRVDRHLL